MRPKRTRLPRPRTQAEALKQARKPGLTKRQLEIAWSRVLAFDDLAKIDANIATTGWTFADGSSVPGSPAQFVSLSDRRSLKAAQESSTDDTIASLDHAEAVQMVQDAVSALPDDYPHLDIVQAWSETGRRIPSHPKHLSRSKIRAQTLLARDVIEKFLADNWLPDPWARHPREPDPELCSRPECNGQQHSIHGKVKVLGKTARKRYERELKRGQQ